MQVLRELLDRLGIRPEPAATEAEIAHAEAKTGLTFPPELRELYLYANGVTIDEYSLIILSLEKAVEQWEILRTAGYPQVWGYFPFTDSNDSNPYCVCCHPPLTGYVVKVSHDDSAALFHYTLQGFFLALSELLEPFDSPDDEGWMEEGHDIEALPNEYHKPKREGHDREIALQLIDFGYSCGDPDTASVVYVERGDAFRFAITLLDVADTEKITSLLVFPNTYIREEAKERLKELRTP